MATFIAPNWDALAITEKTWHRDSYGNSCVSDDGALRCKVGHISGYVSANYDGILYGIMGGNLKKWSTDLDGKNPAAAEAWACKQVEAQIDALIAQFQKA